MKAVRLNEITFMQYIAIVHSTQIGTGVFSLPGKIASKAGTDGWISILIAWALNTLAGSIILLLLRKFPDDPLPSLLGKIFGKSLGKLLLLPAVAYFGYYGFTILVNSMLYIKSWFLPKTPAYLVMILFAVPTFMLVRNGIRVIGRYAEFVLYAMAWMPLFVLFPLGSGHWVHLLPVLKDGWGPVLRGVPDTVFSFAGLEILFFVYPFLKNKKQAFQGMLIANSLTMVLYVFVTISCFILFPPEEVTLINQPLMNLLKTIEFRFLERFDMVSLALYLFVVSRSWSLYSFAAMYSLSRMFNREDHAGFTAAFLIAVVAIVFFAQPTWNYSDRAENVLTIVNIWTLYAIPIALLAFIQIKAFFGRRQTG